MQVRNLDANVQSQLSRAAEREGLSLSAFLRRELTDLAHNLKVRELAGHETSLQEILGGPIPGLENISTQEIVDIIREDRGDIE